MSGQRMSRPILLMMSAGTVILFLLVPRLPAPIIEEITPTPSPKVKPTTKPNVTSENSESQAKPAPSPKSRPTANQPRFAGTWIGAATWTSLSAHPSSTYSIQISPDERTVSADEKGQSGVDLHQSQIACHREGDGLAWNYEQKGTVLITGTCTLRSNSNGTASMAEERTFHMFLSKEVHKLTGTLTRQ